MSFTLRTDVKLADGKMAKADVVFEVSVLSAMVVPEVVVPPPPPPAPTKFKPVINKRQMNFGMMIVFTAWHWDKDGRYSRGTKLVNLTGEVGEVEIAGCNWLSGGAPRALQMGVYTLMFDGVDVATVTIPPGATRATFKFPLAGIEPGWKIMDVKGLGPTETVAPFACYVEKGPIVNPALIPLIRGSYDLTNSVDKQAMWAWVPREFNPKVEPLPARVYTKPKSIERKDLHLRHICPVRVFDLYRLNKTKKGLETFFDAQPYYFSTQMAAMFTNIASYDGPRGMGTITQAAHILPSRAVINGVQRRAYYVLESHRFVHVAEDGHITTLYGLVSKDNIAPYWEEPGQGIISGFKMIGEVSALGDKPYMRDPWGFAFDERTTITDPSKPKIDGEEQHPGAVVWFIADSGNNRVLRCERATRTSVTKVTLWKDGLADPWSIQIRAGKAYIAERQAHRIGIWNLDTATLDEVLVQGAPCGVTFDNQNRRPLPPLGVHPSIGLPQRQAVDVCAPEGSALWGDWYYYASLMQQQIRRINLVTREKQVMVNSPVGSAKAQFFHLEVDPGWVGEPGTMLLNTWSEERRGYPYMYRPDGTEIPSWLGGAAGGTGLFSDQVYYGSATAVAPWGAMVGSGMGEGLWEASATGQPGDTPEPPQAYNGRIEASQLGYRMFFGSTGWPLNKNIQRPWGDSLNMDAFFRFYGHLPPD